MIIENQKAQAVSDLSCFSKNDAALFRLFKLMKSLSFSWKYYKLSRQVAAERQRLLDLPDYRLKDMGISRADVLKESQRQVNDLPKQRVDEL